MTLAKPTQSVWWLIRRVLRADPVAGRETEQLIQDAVEVFHGERTILLVSHRLSTVMRADQVVVFRREGVVETGSPAVLQTAPRVSASCSPRRWRMKNFGLDGHASRSAMTDAAGKV
jgi:energy-coupling factor transporter ATP-binding protein EcfA2